MVVPTNDSVVPPPGGYLVKKILEIGPGQTLFAPFDRNGVQGIKADNMNGGTVVVVLSPYAVGVTYLIPPSETNGDNSPLTEEQAEATMLQFHELYRQHAQYFPPEKQEAYVIYAMRDREIVFPNQQLLCFQRLMEMGIHTLSTDYTIGRKRRIRFQGQMLVCKTSTRPEMHVESRCVGPCWPRTQRSHIADMKEGNVDG